MWTYLLPTLLLLQSIVVQAQIPTPFLGGLPRIRLTEVLLLGYNKDGCQTVPDFGGDIRSNLGCNPINTGIGITNVVVIASDQLPSTCILTLYGDSNCLGISTAQIGPIFPSSRPSACIGPIRNPAGDVFEAKGATLKC